MQYLDTVIRSDETGRGYLVSCTLCAWSSAYHHPLGEAERVARQHLERHGRTA